MKKVELEETNVKAAYKLADAPMQTILKALCPSVKFENKITNYTDIDEFDDAYRMVEDSHTTIGDILIEEYNKIKTIFPAGTYFNALAQIRIVVFAANGCDESFPNWKDESQKKWRPYFYMDKAGVGFSFHVAHYDSSNTTVGSRLEFKDAERCKHFAQHKNFQPLYKIIFNQ